MTIEQQKISTPSVIDIKDSKILASAGYADLSILPRATWDAVLSALEQRALTPATYVAAMDAALSPNISNPFVTKNYLSLKLSCRGLILIGQIGSNADFEGTTDAVFTQAIASLPEEGGIIGVLAGSSDYVFNSTVSLPENVSVVGIHPLEVKVRGFLGFEGSLFSLAGERSRVEFLTLESPSATEPLIFVESSATSASVVGCRLQNYGQAGVALSGDKSYVRSSLFSSDTVGVRFQGRYQLVESCTFTGLMEGGAIQFESSLCSAIGNNILDDVLLSYGLSSPSCSNNKLVANQLGSPTAVSASYDYGTATVRYANTPNTFEANENNFLTMLQNYTGQPLLDTTDMILSNQFAHDPSTDKNATTILSSLDLFTRKLYQERSWQLVSDNPTFDSVGNPTLGIFSWNGTTLTWPSFQMIDVVSGTLGSGKRWSVSFGSADIPSGSALVISLTAPQTLVDGVYQDAGDATPTLQVLVRPINTVAKVTTHHSENLKVLAYNVSGSLVWLQGFRVMTNLTSFDVDGLPLPYARYIGLEFPRTQPLPPDSFALGSDFTDKLGEQSALLDLMTERTNLRKLSTLSGNASIDMTPILGTPEWLDLTSQIPAETPTHILQLRGSAFALFPSTGLYRWDRGNAYPSWVLIPSCPILGAFVSASYLGTGIVLMNTSGQLAQWKDDEGAWSSLAPTYIATAGEIISNVGSNVSSYFNISGNTQINACQFTPSLTEYVTSVTVKLQFYYTGTITGNLVCKIYGFTTTPNRADVKGVSNLINTSLITTSPIDFNFTFPTPVPVTAGVTYAFGISTDGSTVFTGNAFIAVKGMYDTSTTKPAYVWGGVSWANNYPVTFYGMVYTSSSLSINKPALMLGQYDYALQTVDYTLFSTTDGKTFVYNQQQNVLKEKPKIHLESPRSKALLGRHLKDTGYNVARNGDWTETGDNGAISSLYGLPLGSASSVIEIDPYIPTLGNIKWNSLSQESWSYDQATSAFMLVAYLGNDYYVLGGGVGRSKLYSIINLGTTSPFVDFTPHGWLTDCSRQEVMVFGATNSTLAFTAIRGVNTATGFTWTKTVVGGANSNQGAVGVIARYDDRGSGGIHVLASDKARNNRPTWWIFSYATMAWTFNTLTAVSAAIDNSFNYVVGTSRMGGWGVAAVDTSNNEVVSFLVRDSSTVNGVRGGRPTCFSYNVGTSSYSATRLCESGGVGGDVGANAVSFADVNNLQFVGAFYWNSLKAIMFVSIGGSGSYILRAFTYFYVSNSWCGSFFAASTVTLPSFLQRTGSLVGIAPPPSSSVTDDSVGYRYAYGWSNVGLIRAGFLARMSSTTISSTAPLVVDKRQPSLLPIFSTNPLNLCTVTLASSRNDLSLQVYSNADRSIPLFGATTCSTTSDLSGLAWFEPGIKVKNLKAGLWAGLNRGGYLWIGNTALANYQQELAPSTLPRGGEIILANFGATTDYTWAFNSDQTLVVFVYSDSNNSNRLTLLIYNMATNAVTQERMGVDSLTGLPPAHPAATVVLYSTPKISFNSSKSKWSIVAQTSTGQIVFYTRTTGGTWTGERVFSSGGEVIYLDMIANAGKTPSTPIYLDDGSALVATSSGGSNDLLLSKRTDAGLWSKIFTNTGTPNAGGFSEPQIVRTLDTRRWWVFGNSKVALSPMDWDGVTTNWSLFSSSSPSLDESGYSSRVSTACATAYSNGVIVATSGAVEGSIAASRELLVWYFDNAGTVRTVGAFAPKGRLQSVIYSGDEEGSIRDLSWASNGALLYGASRSTGDVHWSLRSSSDWTKPQGESLLGSGRCTSIGERHFREQWISSTDTQYIIHEYGLSGYVIQWTSLPLAQRTSNSDFMGLKWLSTTLPLNTRLFITGDTGSISDDTTLPVNTATVPSPRNWPVIIGSTKLDGRQTGAAVFHLGSMLGLYPPSGLVADNLTYFGVSTLGSSNLFKLRARPAITFKGTHKWWADPSKMYTVPPSPTLTFELDPTSGKHLMLTFNTASSLAQTTPAYWSETNHSSSTYEVVVGSSLDQGFVIYPSSSNESKKLLNYGHMEPRELLNLGFNLEDFCYFLPDIKRPDLTPIYVVLTGYGSSFIFAVKDIESLRGIQPLTFSNTTSHQLVLRRVLPNGGWFLSQRNRIGVSSTYTESIASISQKDTSVVANPFGFSDYVLNTGYSDGFSDYLSGFNSVTFISYPKGDPILALKG